MSDNCVNLMLPVKIFGKNSKSAVSKILFLVNFKYLKFKICTKIHQYIYKFNKIMFIIFVLKNFNNLNQMLIQKDKLFIHHLLSQSFPLLTFCTKKSLDKKILQQFFNIFLLHTRSRHRMIVEHVPLVALRQHQPVGIGKIVIRRA